MSRIALILATALGLALAACSGGGDDPTATPHPHARGDAGGRGTAEATPEPGATLVPKDIFARVSPSIAFVDTPLGTGSGILIAERWLVSNAHVVWPFDEVRVVFADGTEFVDARVHAWDLMADLAVIRLPEGHGIPAVEFADPGELPTGSELFLIGYPAENEELPQPTISGGVLSRFREWPAAELTYVQTDAAIAGGQSGGALVSDAGFVVGLSGFKFADAFGLALAAPIVERRTNALIDGTDLNALSDRRLARQVSDAPISFTLANFYDTRAFIVREPVGATIDVGLNGFNDAIIDVYNAYGGFLTSVDETESGRESVSFEVDLEGPFIVIASQLNVGVGDFEITGSPGVALQHDPDDGRLLTPGRTYIGAMDYPADLDVFELRLLADETVTIRVETLAFDPDIVIDSPDNTGDALGYDDDSAGGMFGTDAELTFTAPSTGSYLISLGDVNLAEVGGYYLLID